MCPPNGSRWLTSLESFQNASGKPDAGKERHIVLSSTPTRETPTKNIVKTLQQNNDQDDQEKEISSGNLLLYIVQVDGIERDIWSTSH
jgi:hypothetical protein